MRDRIVMIVLLLFGYHTVPLQGAPAGKPNTLLILADDLGHEAINSYGGTSYRTPSIDALAKSGVRFTSCYATPPLLALARRADDGPLRVPHQLD